MKFIKAVKALGPGQLLVNPHGCNFEITDGFLKPVTSQVYAAHVLYQDIAGWQVIDKPRPRVKFADAMRAALDGKVICCVNSKCKYKLLPNGFSFSHLDHVTYISSEESKSDWEIIEPEGDK